MDRHNAKSLIHGFDIYRLQQECPANILAHCHSFHKIIFLWHGVAQGVIEGKKFLLQPKDVIFISAGEVHFPVLKENTPYDCTILCVAPEFLKKNKRDKEDLAQCFRKTKENHGVMHMVTNYPLLLDKLSSLEKNENLIGFADNLYREILFLECMILINHGIYTKTFVQIPHETFNPSIAPLLKYINENLDKKLVIDDLAKKFFFSRYYMMHKFKSEIGVSIYKYIIIKRLFLAKRLLSENYSISQVCHKCGFRDYPSFSRAFRTMFLQSPKEYREESQKNFSILQCAP